MRLYLSIIKTTSSMPIWKTISAFTAPDKISSNIYKRNISTDVFHSIDWTALQNEYESIPILQRPTISKLLHSWQHTGHLQNKITPGTAPTCPNCSEKETSDHVFCCVSERILIHKHAAIDRFISTLHQIKTSPEILQVLKQKYIGWLLNTPPDTETHLENQDFAQA